jgi:hypothetical protein
MKKRNRKRPILTVKSNAVWWFNILQTQFKIEIETYDHTQTDGTVITQQNMHLTLIILWFIKLSYTIYPNTHKQDLPNYSFTKRKVFELFNIYIFPELSTPRFMETMLSELEERKLKKRQAAIKDLVNSL